MTSNNEIGNEKELEAGTDSIFNTADFKKKMNELFDMAGLDTDSDTISAHNINQATQKLNKIISTEQRKKLLPNHVTKKDILLVSTLGFITHQVKRLAQNSFNLTVTNNLTQNIQAFPSKDYCFVIVDLITSTPDDSFNIIKTLKHICNFANLNTN